MLNLPKTLSSEEVIVTFFKKKLLMGDSLIHGLRNLSILSGSTDHTYKTLLVGGGYAATYQNHWKSFETFHDRFSPVSSKLY